MHPDTRTALTRDLAELSARAAGHLRERILAEPDARARAGALWHDERIAEDFEVWTDVLSRRAAVLWVLKSVYARVLEDRGLIKPVRLIDGTSHDLFRALAPDLGEAAYLRWVYRDLARVLPELFTPQPAEILAPNHEYARELLTFWRRRDPDTDELVYSFADESFDSRFLGDLYQDLDPVVKQRFALLQTPDFVLEFILDETLTPAIATFGIDVVRVLDPACGSGHFLLAAFRRLVDGMRAEYPDMPMRTVVRDCLERVVGIDLNDYACGLARARLVMTALELLGEPGTPIAVTAARDLRPQVFWADALEQVELDEIGQMDLFAPIAPRVQATLSRPEVRDALRPVLKPRFHAVVGNPPYITEKDNANKAYHREKIAKPDRSKKERRYVSASGKYSLGAVFTERMLQLSAPGGYVGQITANSFMKREFGKGLVQQVLPRYRLTKIVDTSGAYIPGHGTPTVLLFGRCPEHAREPRLDAIPVIMAKRGEPDRPDPPSKGRVWTSIAKANRADSFENEYISRGLVSAERLQQHPWSIGGGGASELKESLEIVQVMQLSQLATEVGISAVTGEDEVYAMPDDDTFSRLGVLTTRPLTVGEQLKDWSSRGSLCVIWTYETDFLVAIQSKIYPTLRYLWSFRARLSRRKRFGTPMLERGLTWYEWQELYADKLRTSLTIAFGEVATHNHFVLDRGGKVFNRTAPVIKLPADKDVDDHLCLLGQLNSSTACFWMKQVCQCKGAGGINEGLKLEKWGEFYQFGGTKLKAFPLVAIRHERIEAFARDLDKLGHARVADSVANVIDQHAADGANALRATLDQRRARDKQKLLRMVGLQEELDWLCYRLYAVDSAPEDQPDPMVDICPPQRDPAAHSRPAPVRDPARPRRRPACPGCDRGLHT